MTFAPNRGPSRINPDLIPPHLRPYMDFQAQTPTGTAPGAMPAATNAYWRPSFLNTPAVPYPGAAQGTSTGGRGGGGGGGRGGFGSVSNTYNAYDPTMFLGAGAYMPGDHADFQRRMQNEIQLAQQGIGFDARQPAQVAAFNSYIAANSFNPNARRQARASLGLGGGSYGSAGGIGGDFQRAQDDARQANEARYRDILEGYDSRMGYLQGAGAQEAADINEAYDAQKAAGLQSLTGRGLGNSTLVNTMGMGYDRERSNSLGRLEERLRNQYLDTQKDTLDFMERRTDSYPDLNLLSQIGQLQGQSGAGATQGYQLSMSTIPGANPFGGGFYPMYNLPGAPGAGNGVWGRVGGATPRADAIKYAQGNRAASMRAAMASESPEQIYAARHGISLAEARRRQDAADARLFD